MVVPCKNQQSAAGRRPLPQRTRIAHPARPSTARARRTQLSHSSASPAAQRGLQCNKASSRARPQTRRAAQPPCRASPRAGQCCVTHPAVCSGTRGVQVRSARRTASAGSSARVARARGDALASTVMRARFAHLAPGGRRAPLARINHVHAVTAAV